MIDKKLKAVVQGGAKNYLGKQKQVQAPIKWKSSPDSPETELAYITKAEKDLLVKKDLHGSLNGDVNRGPSGIMSLDGYGSFDGNDPSQDTGMSGAATSAAETGSRNARDTRDVQAQMNTANLGPGVMPTQAQDYRNAFIASGAGQRVNPGFFDSRNTVSPAELTSAKAFAPQAFKKTRGSGIMNFIRGGGFLGNIARGIGQKFGLGKNYNEPTYDMSEFNQYELGGSQTPTNYNDLDNELMLSTEVKPSTRFDINDIASLIEASKGIDTSMYGADQDIYGVENARGLFRPSQQSTDFNTKYSPDGITYDAFDEQPEGIMGIDVGYDDPAFENDLMAKLNSMEIREKATLQTGKDLGMNTPEQNEKLKQLEKKEKEATLNTTAIV